MAKKNEAAPVASVLFVDGRTRIEIESTEGDFIVMIDGLPVMDNKLFKHFDPALADCEDRMQRFLRFSKQATAAFAETGVMDADDVRANSEVTELLFNLNTFMFRNSNFHELDR